MGGIHHDDFVIFVGGIFANPIRIQDAQRTDLASDTLLFKNKSGFLCNSDFGTVKHVSRHGVVSYHVVG